MANPADFVLAQHEAGTLEISAQSTLDEARKDDEVLLQLVEACLFMRGEAILENDIADNLNMSIEAIHAALVKLSDRYENKAGAMRVREIDDGMWLMDLHEDVAEHVDTFFLEDVPFTRSEIMSLAFIAYSQPVPRQVLSFYRGSNAGSHAHKLVDAGFIKEEMIPSGDGRVKEIVAKYKQDLAERLAETPEQVEQGEKKEKRGKKRASWLESAEYACFTTTNRFCGYFNLPREVDKMKSELENWKDIYNLFR